MADTGDFRDQVREKLVGLKYFEENPEALARVFFFLDEADKECIDAVDAGLFSPYWKNFKYLLNRDEAFESLAKRYAEDTRRVEQNPKFLKVMRDLYDKMMTASDDGVPLDGIQGFDLQLVVDKNTADTFSCVGLARAWHMVPAETQTRFLHLLPKMVDSKSLVFSVDECVGLVNKHGGQVVMYTLAAVYLGFSALKSIRRWWRGEISGKRCIKNVIDTSLTTAAGVGGGMGGAALGTFLCPGIGTVCGGFLGGVLGSLTTSMVSDRLTQWLFDLPKDEAVENAYRYLEVKPSASNAEVNTAFRKLCLKHHPDKGGSADEFFILQNSMAVIRLARGEM